MRLADIPDFLPGDVLFYSPSDVVGLLIAVKTWTWLSHVESIWDIQDNKHEVVAARISGVNTYPIRIDKHLVAIRRPVRFNKLEGHLSVNLQLGQSYEVSSFERFFNPWAKSWHISRICSSIVTAYLRGGGIEPFNPQVSADQIAPAQLWQTPVLRTIWIRKGWIKEKLRLLRNPAV